jgi:hypothetical protein
MSPATVSNGMLIWAKTGPCKTFSTVTSSGLREPITLFEEGGEPNTLKGYAAATTEPGTYTATVQCGGRTLATRFTVLPLEIKWYLVPAEVEPGGKISAGGDVYTGCFSPGPLESPGFAAPLRFTRGGNMGRFAGDTTVITTPGVYEVAFQCFNRPERSVKTFRILGTPPTTTTPPQPGTPKPKPPIVKPRGAPNTGGGGTAQ